MENSRTSPEDASTPPPKLSPMCGKCGTIVENTFKFCPHCGYRLDSTPAWYYHPIAILLMGLVVLGPFVLPLIWLSPKMGKTAKLILAAVILIYTFYLIYETFVFASMLMNHMGQYGDIMREVNSVVKSGSK